MKFFRNIKMRIVFSRRARPASAASPVLTLRHVLPPCQPRHGPLSDGSAAQTCRGDGQASGGNGGGAGGDGQTPGGDCRASRDIRRADGLAGAEVVTPV